MSLPQSYIDEMKEYFDLFDDKKEYKISNTEIMVVMSALGEHPTEESVAKLTKAVDFDGDGMVDFEEFTCLLVKHVNIVNESEEELVEVFKRFDKDEDGVIGALDLLQMMTELGNVISLEDAEDLIHTLDGDTDG